MYIHSALLLVGDVSVIVLVLLPLVRTCINIAQLQQGHIRLLEETLTDHCLHQLEVWCTCNLQLEVCLKSMLLFFFLACTEASVLPHAQCHTRTHKIASNSQLMSMSASWLVAAGPGD